MYPDIAHATIKGKDAAAVLNDEAWYKKTFIPTVAQVRMMMAIGFQSIRLYSPQLKNQEQKQKILVEYSFFHHWHLRTTNMKNSHRSFFPLPTTILRPSHVSPFPSILFGVFVATPRRSTPFVPVRSRSLPFAPVRSRPLPFVTRSHPFVTRSHPFASRLSLTARRRHHRRARSLVGRVRRRLGDRPHSRLGERHAGATMTGDGDELQGARGALTDAGKKICTQKICEEKSARNICEK
jgi:hypothetical protein